MFDTRRGHSSPSGPLWWFPTFSSMIFPLKSPLLQDNITKNITIFHDFWWFFPYIFHWYTDFVADSPLAMDDTRTRTYRTGTPEAFLLRPCATWCGGATTAAEFAAKHHLAGGNPWEFPWEFPGCFFWDVLILTGWCFFWDSIHQNGCFMGFNGIEPTRNGDLVGGDWNMNGLFFHILGISWSQLTHIFQRGWNHQPVLISISQWEHRKRRTFSVNDFPEQFWDLHLDPLPKLEAVGG